MNEFSLSASDVYITLIAIAFACVQWRTSRIEEKEARIRQRDADLISWGTETIFMMAKLESDCSRPDARDEFYQKNYSQLAWKASALADQGKLYFANYMPKEGYAGKYTRGIRPKIIDEVVRAHFIAAYLAECDPDDMARRQLSANMKDARKRFIQTLQIHIEASWHYPPLEQVGDYIEPNPLSWNRAQ